ncbi:MAG: glycosyltransferase family 4 protein [Gammaproteobacteria bacterium]|nr:glycosyltransferase family 4 protein [Gammaproteobacteria bacterium]MDH3535428.1 glycosyltransferase family 4 protein [Gammaproteobacteria bacterium]
MKILLCHERYKPDFVGGGEVVVHETAVNLARLGMEVKVITTGDPVDNSVDGIPIHRLPVHPYRFNFAADAVTEMAESVDLIQTFNYHACLPALAAGRRAGKPVVCGILALFDDAWRNMRGPFVGRLFQAWERRMLRMDYSRVFFLSEFSRQLGLDLGVDPQRTFIASPGVDVEAFRPDNVKEDVVLFAAKLDPRKGVDELVAVARALPQVRFRVAGWGQHPCARPLYTLPNVEVIVCETQDRLSREFARARIFFFPSLAETYGMVLVEAMASGCAIVSTIDLDYAGIKVKPLDASAMVDAIRELWEDRAQTAAMAEENIRRAQSITWDRYAKTLESTYRELLNAGKGAVDQ